MNNAVTVPGEQRRDAAIGTLVSILVTFLIWLPENLNLHVTRICNWCWIKGNTLIDRQTVRGKQRWVPVWHTPCDQLWSGVCVYQLEPQTSCDQAPLPSVCQAGPTYPQLCPLGPLTCPLGSREGDCGATAADATTHMPSCVLTESSPQPGRGWSRWEHLWEAGAGLKTLHALTHFILTAMRCVLVNLILATRKPRHRKRSHMEAPESELKPVFLQF